MKLLASTGMAVALLAAFGMPPRCEQGLHHGRRLQQRTRHLHGFEQPGTEGLSAWEHLTTVTKAYALGFGKAAPGASYPTMYVSGIVGNVQGVFRSTDKGQNWVRIDSSQHQLGASTALTGDPKVFGTVYVSDGGRGIAVGTSSN